jgi:hypothetical protein
MGSSTYKTVECMFYAQDRCLKGDNCTFRHGSDDPKAPQRPQSPPKFMRPIPHWHTNITQKGLDEIDLCKKLSIETWESYPRQFYYRIRGEVEDCKQYYENYILAEYPSNPYFTKIIKEGNDFIEVSRSTTSS